MGFFKKITGKNKAKKIRKRRTGEKRTTGTGKVTQENWEGTR